MISIYSVVDLTKLVGPLEFPGNETGAIEVPELSLSGEKGLWGKGILLKDTYSERVICASITVYNDIVKFKCLYTTISF